MYNNICSCIISAIDISDCTLCASMHMQKTYNISHISTPKIPDSFQFQVERSHTLSNWDAIRKEFWSSTRTTCFLRSSAATQKKCRRRKRQFQRSALVAMSTWTGMTYHRHVTPGSKACPMKILKRSDALGHYQDLLFWIHHAGLPSSFQCLLWSQHFFVASCPVPVAHRDIRARCKPQGRQWTDVFLNRNFNAEPINTQADRRKEDTIRWCTNMQTACMCPVHSCKFGIGCYFGNIPASYQGLGNGVRSRYWCDFSVISHVT